MATIAAVKTSVQGYVSAVSGVSKCETKVLGQSPWAERARPGQSFWQIQMLRRQETEAGTGPACFQRYTAQVEGWMPFSYENPDSTVAWDALLDAVCDTLRAHRSLGQSANDSSLPQVTANNFESFAGRGDRAEVLCHHATIEVGVRIFKPYTTT